MRRRARYRERRTLGLDRAGFWRTAVSISWWLSLVMTSGCGESKPFSEGSRPVCDEQCSGMVWVPPGELLLGAPPGEGSAREHPQLTIQLQDGFWIDRHEVTNTEYRAFLAAHGNECELFGTVYPCHDCFEFAKDDSGLDCDNDFAVKSQCQAEPAGPATASCAQHPVVNITPAGALAYCRWRGKTLPSEAQWEHAASAFQMSPEGWARFPWGGQCPSEFNTTGDELVGELSACSGEAWTMARARANCEEASCHDGFDRTSPVGYFEARLFEVTGVPNAPQDMAGNVLERVADCYHGTYSVGAGPPRDGSVWSDVCEGEFGIARGSGYADPGGALRNQARTDEVSRESADPDVGFRCVLVDLGLD